MMRGKVFVLRSGSPAVESYDVVVVGGGVAGMQAAFKAVYRDKRVALVERERLGGTCLTRGCIPTKAMIRSGEVAHLARRGDEFGVRIDGGVRVDLARVVARKDEIVDRVVKVNEDEVDETETLDLYRTTARFVDPHTLEMADGTRIRGDLFILAHGARTHVPGWPGLADVPYLTSRSLLDLTELPEHLLVVGGGYIGLECAQMMARFGARVTVVQRSVVLKEEDQEIIDVLRAKLRSEGVEILEHTSVLRVEGGPGEITLLVEREGKETELHGDALLVAIGRRPNSDLLEVANAGIETWGPGWVTVDEHLRTNQPHIFAVGDCIGKQLFTHVARYEVEVAIANALEDGNERVDYLAAPYAVFTDPELGRVGRTLAEAREAGFDAEEITFTFEHLGKALCLGEEEGLIKIVAERGTGRLLGCHILAAHGGELIHEAIVVMHQRGTVDDLADAIHIHPTMAEGVNDAAFEMAIALGRRAF